MEKNTQPESAFPYQVQGPTTGPEISCGMTLRDYFAAKAMEGYLSDASVDWEPENLERHASDFYMMADAMLVSREGK